MSDFFEIDFLDVETKKSGDAICIRYQQGDTVTIHVVDGGYQSTSDKIISHLDTHYGKDCIIDHVVVTHNDGDHTGGLIKILEERDVRNLWMLRPWIFADELIQHFPTYSSVNYLRGRLRSAYGNLATLEDIAIEREIPIRDAFRGTAIGAFRVMAPTKELFLRMVTESEKTPVTAKDESLFSPIFKSLLEAASKLKSAIWGEEYFPKSGSSSENEMSIVQYAYLNDRKILLTGDTGRDGLAEAISYAPFIGLNLPGLDYFQVPHHGGRHNVNTEVLDALLGPRLAVQPAPGSGNFTTVISSAKADEDHPRKSVVRAMIHRGGKVYTTEGQGIQVNQNAPKREGWSSAPSEPYPTEQEE
ncbi:ComEC/Rec2 family competence protein [Labrys portucalensis]|uniref:ComEC/Rec2 family competence protein n=1 Tax=Labrys neptuniae TaxID=376174 RepID=A0ABV6ZRL6_9HYPH